MDDNKDTKNDWSIPVSILIGSIIIASAIVWGVLRAYPSSPVYKAVPEGGKKVASRSDAPRVGKGKLEVMEYADFQCPFCKNFYTNTYNQIKSKYIDTGKITFVFRHFPLGFHRNAQKSAEAAECASRQGKFEEYHNMLFSKALADGGGLDMPDLKQYAATLGLNTGSFNKCLDGGEATAAVKTDLQAGIDAGVTGTPTFFINGQKIVGAQPSSVFEQAIEEALKK